MERGPGAGEYTGAMSSARFLVVVATLLLGGCYSGSAAAPQRLTLGEAMPGEMRCSDQPHYYEFEPVDEMVVRLEAIEHTDVTLRCGVFATLEEMASEESPVFGCGPGLDDDGDEHEAFISPGRVDATDLLYIRLGALLDTLCEAEDDPLEGGWIDRYRITVDAS